PHRLKAELRTRLPLERARDCAEIDESGTLAGLAHQVGDQLDRLELRVHDIQAGGMAQEIEDGTLFDGPFDAQPNRLEKPVQLPAPAAEDRDVADGTHRHLDQTARIHERL